MFYTDRTKWNRVIDIEATAYSVIISSFIVCDVSVLSIIQPYDCRGSFWLDVVCLY